MIKWMRYRTKQGRVHPNGKFHAFDTDKNKSLCHRKRMDTSEKTSIQDLHGPGETYDKYRHMCCWECMEKYERKRNG